MRVAYADPPYLGRAELLYGEQAREWDELERHRDLIDELEDQYDAWALSLSSTTLRQILPLTPLDTRLYVWVKPFAAFKKNVNPAYAWEPILVRGARPRTDENVYIRDWAAENIALKKGLTGAKPRNVCWWLFDVMNLKPLAPEEDELFDLFPGTGIVLEAWEEYGDRYHEVSSRINFLNYKWEQKELGEGLRT